MLEFALLCPALRGRTRSVHRLSKKREACYVSARHTKEEDCRCPETSAIICSKWYTSARWMVREGEDKQRVEAMETTKNLKNTLERGTELVTMRYQQERGEPMQ